MSMNLVILRLPLWYVKSRTYHRVLTMMFCLPRTQYCHHGSSSHFFVWSNMQILIPSPNQTTYQYERNLLGTLTYLPHTWSLHCQATKLKCVEFKSLFVFVHSSRHIKMLQSVLLSCLQVSFVRRFFDLHLKWLATKNTRGKTICSCFLLNGNKIKDSPSKSPQRFVCGQKLDHENSCSYHW